MTPTALRHVGAVRGKPVALPAQTPDRGAAHDAQGLLLRRVGKGNDILCVLGSLRSQQSNDNNCSEASHHGNSDSIVVMFCVSVPVHRELED